jgi:hypothetical protein
VSDVIFFDHDEATLDKVARDDCGFSPSVNKGETKDSLAATAILNDESWKVAVVHIGDPEWATLSKSCPKYKSLLRFSSQGFRPRPLEPSEGLCVHCLVSTKRITKEDLDTLVLLIQDPVIREGLRKGIIDERLSCFISFRLPHNLRALFAMLQAVLAYWSQNCTGKLAGDAEKLLGASFKGTQSPRGIDLRESFWRHLSIDTSSVLAFSIDGNRFRREIAAELGGLDQRTAISELVDDMLTGRGDECPNPETVLSTFPVIEKYVTKS